MQQTPREVHDRIYREALQYIKQHSKFPYVAYTEHLSAVSLETLLQPIDLTKHPETFGPRDDDPFVPLSMVFADLPAEDRDHRSLDALVAGPEDIEKLRWAFKLEKQAGRRDGYERIMNADEANPYPAAMRSLEYQLSAKTLRLTPRVSGKKDRNVPSRLAQLAEDGGPYSWVQSIGVDAIRDERPDVDEALNIHSMLEPAVAKKARDFIRDMDSSIRQRITETNLFPEDDPIWDRWDAEDIKQAEHVPRTITPPVFPQFLEHESLHPSSDVEAAKLVAAAAPVESAGPGGQSLQGGSMIWMPLQGTALDDPYAVHLLDEFGDKAFEPLTPTTKPSRSSRPSVRGNSQQEVLWRSLKTPSSKHPWDEDLWIDEPLTTVLYDPEIGGPSNRPTPSATFHSQLAQPGKGSPIPQEQSQICTYKVSIEYAQGEEPDFARGEKLDLAYPTSLYVPSIRDQPLPPRAMSPMNYEEALYMGQIENELPGEVRSVVYEALGMSWEPFPGIVNAPTHSSATHAEPPKRSLNAEETMLIPNHDFWLPPSPQHRMGDMLGYPREDESRQGRDFIDDRECDVRDFTVHMELASQSAAAQPPSDRSTFQLPIVPPPPKKLPEFALVSETETHEGKLHVDAPINIPARDSSPRPLECSQVSRRTSPTSELRPAPLSAGVQAELSAHVESHPTVKERRTPRKTRPGADGRSLKDLVFGKRSARFQRAGNSVAAIDESGDLRQLYDLKPSRPAPAPVIEHTAEIDDVDKTPPSWMSNASIKNPAWYLAATRRSLIKPKTRDVLGSMRLMQDRPLLRGLAQHGLNVTERDTSLQEADLIISPMTAVIFRSLTSFTNASQDSRVLVNSLKVAATFFKRVIVVLCTVPYAAFDKPDINGRSPHDVNPLSQAVVEGLGALRRKVAVGIQRDGTRIIGEVQFAFASHGAAEVGKVLRVIMDREEDMQRKISDGRGDGMVGTRNWLEQDWSEDEGALVDEYGVNAFSALFILSKYGSLDRFSDSTTPAQREHELGPVLGAEVTNRLNNLLEKRLDLVRRAQKRGEFAGYSSDPISSMSDMSQQIYTRLGSPALVQKPPLYRHQGHLGTTLKTST
ncbi:hypothetical protein EHS25_010288 [Saitozyma podzolica]|uniref:Uncharacterized protein n=1 Tax=Saitozyma podzolica TaxID=1890683 RepID=A0A427YJ51_9TREE|nr:hypothetical protein EHS25_010288 [Saitozyma podzolica]